MIPTCDPPFRAPAGPYNLTALPCGSGDGVRVQKQQWTGEMRFKFRRAAGRPPTDPFFGSPIDIVSYSREAYVLQLHRKAAAMDCSFALGLGAAAAGAPVPKPPAEQCGRWEPQLGGSRGVQQWVLEDAGAGLVRIRTLVSCLAWEGAWMQCLGHPASWAAAAARPHASGHAYLAPCVQAQPHWCFRYLGVPANCSAGDSLQLYAARNPDAATLWRLTKVH